MPLRKGLNLNRLSSTEAGMKPLPPLSGATAPAGEDIRTVVLASIEEAIQKAARSRFGAEHDIGDHFMIVASEYACHCGVLLVTNGFVLGPTSLNADIWTLEFLRKGRCRGERNNGCPEEHKTGHDRLLS